MGDRLRWASGVQAYRPRWVAAPLAMGAALLALTGALLMAPAPASALGVHQLAKLVGDCTRHCGGPRGTGETGFSGFGEGVAVSGDGNTALIGAPDARVGDGEVWVFVRAGGSWKQQGQPLRVDCTRHCGGAEGTGEPGGGFEFGQAVALSANGNTALIGAPEIGRGRAWVFTRSRGRWRQQGAPFLGFCRPTKQSCTGPNGTGLAGWAFGQAVALSASGNTALIGAPGGQGAVWVFVRSRGRWSQQGSKLRDHCIPSGSVSCTGPNGTGAAEPDMFGSSVALSSDGTTALIGAPENIPPKSHGSVDGAAWVFVYSSGTWSQQEMLIADCKVGPCSGPNGTNEAGFDGQLGTSVALSADGNTALLGAPTNGATDSQGGAAWTFIRSGVTWSQDEELVGDCVGPCVGPQGTGEINIPDNGGGFGYSVALNAAGTSALIGAPYDDSCDNCSAGLSGPGAAWIFTAAGSNWSQSGPKLVGNCKLACGGPKGTGAILAGELGTAVALSGSGTTSVIGARYDDPCRRKCQNATNGKGAAWVFGGL
jgi:FG-GAP repeat